MEHTNSVLNKITSQMEHTNSAAATLRLYLMSWVCFKSIPNPNFHGGFLPSKLPNLHETMRRRG